MKNLKKRGTVAMVSLILLLVAGCGSWSPEQGEGSLRIYEKGVARCVDVTHVSFRTSGWTVYTLSNGYKKEVPGPFEYYACESCSN